MPIVDPTSTPPPQRRPGRRRVHPEGTTPAEIVKIHDLNLIRDGGSKLTCRLTPERTRRLDARVAVMGGGRAEALMSLLDHLDSY